MVEPGRFTHEQRVAKAQEITAYMQGRFGDGLRASVVMGSTSRRQDRPYSDLEMWAVVRDCDKDADVFFTQSGLKISVEITGEKELLDKAARVEENWPIAGSELTTAMVLHDPDGLWPRLAHIIATLADEKFKEAIRGVMLGYLFEYVGKFRNDRDSGVTESFAWMAVACADAGTWLMGLRHRHLYNSTATQYSECLDLPDRPDGLDELVRMAAAGTLADPELVFGAVERFWRGAVVWCERLGIGLESSFERELEGLGV